MSAQEFFRSVDAGTNWTNVTPENEIHNVTTIAQDPRVGNTNTWYYGTGEISGNSPSLIGVINFRNYYHGQGIFKSVNDGQNWSKLISTTSLLEKFDNPFDYVTRIAVNPINGHVYAACYKSIMKSTDQGSSWIKVLGIFNTSDTGEVYSSGFTDVVITPDSGRIYASFSGSITNSDIDGIWTSISGDSSTYTRIAGNGSPGGWKTWQNYGRIVMEIAPSNPDILYAIYYNNNKVNCSIPFTNKPEADFFKYTRSTNSWVNRSLNLPDEAGCNEGNDPFACQGGYDLCITVKPNNENFVVIGGTNAYSSSDGFETNTNTKRIGGYKEVDSYELYLNHHPDIHTLVFSHVNNNTMICGSDGGIHVTNNINADPVV